jgi:hypothetical protein
MKPTVKYKHLSDTLPIWNSLHKDDPSPSIYNTFRICHQKGQKKPKKAEIEQETSDYGVY